MSQPRQKSRCTDDERPNVLLITADHWSGRVGGWTGESTVQTPTLDRLARGGTVFSNAYSACPVCVPARRSLMTGMSTQGHGLRSNRECPMPDAQTLPQCFREAGYQTFAVGKLHVAPQRLRMGFDDVLACEEGRHQPHRPDDWEMYLSSRGLGGRQYDAGGTQNDYVITPWHLPADCHPTNWAAREMSRIIRRRDPTRPAFWYLSFIAPHPPIWPLQTSLDQLRDLPIPQPVIGEWVEELAKNLPSALHRKMHGLATSHAGPELLEHVRRAFYATMTHIDQQIRVVLGTLREEGLAKKTIVVFTSDHGDMLGQHGLWGKGMFYEDSTRIPFIVHTPKECRPTPPPPRVDDRLVEIADIMPTLLGLCKIPVPPTVEGRSVFSNPAREEIFGEYDSGGKATRMLRIGRHKLIYYPEGNRFQFFDLVADPGETTDLFNDPACRDLARDLRARLARYLYGEDCHWLVGDKWIGLKERDSGSEGICDLGCSGQKGHRF